MKKNILIFSLFLVLALSGCTTSVQPTDQSGGSEADPSEYSQKTVIYYFWGDGCPHCTTQKKFLATLQDKYSNLEIKEYETWDNRENQLLFQQMAAAYGIKPQGVPSTFIGVNEPLVGFNDSIGEVMEEQIKTCLKQGCIDPSSKL